ncbi:plasmid pRiA4b ORF-3 family protein [Leptothoe spongobia]|uniref:Plasmid pRiA4b ORF-3 family protein n=1 Tax=Leptothoe spongobia TAU-MAC 1115 TaxID=1967444 RepID=A0A947GNM9_9CYAN|nr:plasmid pRiA4b ORF-3 family protein [Leptothoe spongobia]MBT9316121.1 plasmid pRiA4b ORF-3 family protein [Leptothoe spongobia TAU-MAC 1115]
MANAKKSENVPTSMQDKFDSIVAITDDFAQQHLNGEYAQFIRYAVAALCRKRPSPLAKGRDKTWACGITHAIGMVNFLFDSSQAPHISAKDLYKAFGVSSSTGQSKSKLVRDTLNMYQMDPNWCLPSKLDNNLMAWMISVNGLLVDARSMPRHIQEEAFAKGLIPYLPEDKGDTRGENTTPITSQKAKKPTPKGSTPKGKASKQSDDTLFILYVAIIDGPVTEEFIEENPEISRTIEIKGSHTLKHLHQILFSAFDREDEHLYEFQLGGRGPNDPSATKYGVKIPGEPDSVNDAAKAKMASLGLSKGDMFGYWFDFGDDWWHQIAVRDIKEKAPKGKYPKVTESVGASPPQYAEFD